MARVLQTNSPRVRDGSVSYARVMGERVSMNREGLTDPDVTTPVRVRLADMSRPDPYRVAVPVHLAFREDVEPDYPTFGYLTDPDAPVLPEPVRAPIPAPPRREPGPQRFGSACKSRRVVERTVTVRPELPPPPPVRDGALYVLRVRYAGGGTDWFTYTKRERAERMAAREMAMGSAVQLRARG